MDTRSEISIRIITESKRDFMPLLLLGDENESYINAYLKRGDLFALYDGDLKSICLVTDEGDGVFEIQNIATDKRYQRQGYASQLIDYISTYYAEKCNKIILGTGDVPSVLAFYKRCGFTVIHRLPDYFINNYDHPIIDDGVLLKDKIYLERKAASLYEFGAVIKAEPDSGGAYIEIPFDIKVEFGKGRLKVHAVFDGIAHYNGSIVNMGVKNSDGSVCYIIGITKAIRAKICKQEGDSVRVTIIPQSNKIILKPFTDNDIYLMEKWLQMPHVAKWYKHPDHWLNELKERHDEFSFLTHFIVELDGIAIGFCQYYDTFYAQEHEVWNDEWQVAKHKGEIYSIDYLIGEPKYLGKGYGKQIVAELIKRIWKLGAKKIIVEPEIENRASSGILAANGFAFNGRDYVLENSKHGDKK